MGLDAWAPLRLECDGITNRPALSPCVFASRLGTWSTAPHSPHCSGWGLFLDLGAPLANLTGTLPRLGNLRAPDGLLTCPDLTCSTLLPLPLPRRFHLTM